MASNPNSFLFKRAYQIAAAKSSLKGFGIDEIMLAKSNTRVVFDAALGV